MAYYTYSVKKTLAEYFGADTLSAMRKTHGAVFGPAERQHILPLSWQYADEQTVNLFLEHRFLMDTIIEDDYIAYLYQQGNQQCALLMFMLHEENAPFSIALDYACEIIRKWETNGYNTKIVSQCVCVENYGHSENFRLIHHNASGLGSFIYELIENSGRPMLAFDIHDCWPVYYEKLMHVSKTQDIREYECLFEPTVSITTGDKENKKTIATGLEAVAHFFKENIPVRVCFSEFKNTGIYNRCLLAGDKELIIHVNVRNLISEINYLSRGNVPLIEYGTTKHIESLVTQVPSLIAVRPLDVIQMHGYVIQMSYSDGTTKNYYLKMFDTLQIPSLVLVDGYVFDEYVLRSVTIKDNGVCFDNGYTVKAHILFYHSYRQVQATVTGQKSYRVGNSILRFRYQLPLKEFKSHFAVKHYWGHHGECYGPADTLFDWNGKRVTDISFYGSVDKWRSKSLWRVCVEPTGLYGFLKDDGTWLVPPVYTSADRFENSCAKAERIVKGTPKRVLITLDGKEIDFNHDIDTGLFDGELCPFNVATEPVLAPKPGYYWYHDYDDVKPGKWGYVNIDGQVIVEPQYAYAVGFYNGGGERAVVARLVGEKLFWGVIDGSGKEVIPCFYESVYTRWGDAFAFRRDGEELYGIMDLDGNVIAEPQFEYFEAYDADHRLLTVGEHEDALGVYSLDKQEMIIPMEYDCIDYGEKIISCEIAYTGKEQYFDYDGNELDFSAYDHISEDKGLLRTWRNGKAGFIQMDGTVIIPNILSGGCVNNDLELYQKGYIITGERKQRGFATVDGVEILPQKYADIVVYDDFVIASERNDTNWCICDTLYAYDGTPIIQGAYRRMYYDRNNRELTLETPRGVECFELYDL